MLMFTLVISVWPLPIFLDSGTTHSRFLCNTVLYSTGLYFHHQLHVQLDVIFTLALPLHSFWSYSTLFSSSILGTYWPGSSSFSVPSFCLFILFMEFPRQEYWSGFFHSLLQWTTFCQNSIMTRRSWVALHHMAHHFIELDKAVSHVINLIIFCDCDVHYVCPLMEKDKRLMEASC